MSTFEEKLSERVEARNPNSNTYSVQGRIADISSEDSKSWWPFKSVPTERWVTVVAPAIHGGLPVVYEKVPWDVATTLDATDQSQPPKIGDYVTLTFHGGSTSFPQVTSFRPKNYDDYISHGDRTSIPNSSVKAAHT